MIRKARSKDNYAAAAAATARRCSIYLCSLALCVAASLAQESSQKAFPTPRAAVIALVAAAKADDVSALLDIFGPDGKELTSSGDDVADKNSRTAFVKSYETKHQLLPSGPGKYTLTVGSSGWPLPLPIIKKSNGWVFDSAEGKQEVLYRRIGRNELETIRVCRALVEAERDYARAGHDGNPPGAFTRKMVSDPGQENGLFWEAKEGAPDSPAGPLLAEAAADGYEEGVSRHAPFHGYLFRILSSQGPHAPGGEKDYLVNGKMTGGFAVLAYPVEYGASGVMTFIASRRGILYQKDLGPDTKTSAKSMQVFDPDSSWTRVE